MTSCPHERKKSSIPTTSIDLRIMLLYMTSCICINIIMLIHEMHEIELRIETNACDARSFLRFLSSNEIRFESPFRPFSLLQKLQGSYTFITSH